MSEKEVEIDDEETFKLKNFISFFEKKNITIKSVYILSGRVVFINIFFETELKNLMIYISSKYNISADGIFKFQKYDLKQDDEEPVLDGTEKIVKQFFEDQLDRIANSNVKLIWFNKKRILYINRHNSFDVCSINTSTINSGFYHIVEWEYFFKNHNDILSELSEMDTSLITHSFDQVNNNIDIIRKISLFLVENKDVKKKLNDRTKKFKSIISNNASLSQQIKDIGPVIQQDIFQSCFKQHTLNTELDKIKKIL